MQEKLLIQYFNKSKLLKNLNLTYVNLFDVWANAPTNTEYVAIVGNYLYIEKDFKEIKNTLVLKYPHIQYMED